MAPTKLILQNGHSHQIPNGKPKANGHASGKTNGLIKDASELERQLQVSELNQTNDSQSKSAQALAEVRRRFLEYAEMNPDKVNDRDKLKLATDDWYLKRYLLARNRKVNETLEMLRKTMEWRNEFGIHQSEDAMFPSEFYKIGALFPYENDKNGNLVMYMRIKYHKKIDEMVETEKHFLVHTFEKIDRITNGQGLVIVFDCQGAGYANCDIEFLQFLISCATEHAPVGLQYIIVYRIPWALSTFWSLAKKLLPTYLANRVQFCDEKSITDLIERDNLPDFMGGTCQRNYRWIPPGCPSIFKLANAYGISDAEVNKILPQFQAFLDEAEDALVNSTYYDPPESIRNFVNNSQTAPNLLSDLALCRIGFGSSRPDQGSFSQHQESGESNGLTYFASATDETTSIIRIFPDEFIEFNYHAFSDALHGTVTIFNPSEENSLAFKLMANRPSNYSVKPARGVLSPNSSITLSVVLLNDHKTNDKFLIVAQPLEGEVKSISKAQFDALWSSKLISQGSNNTQSARTTHTTIKLGSYLRKIVTTPAIQSAIKNPQVHELVTTCRSLKRRQSLSIMINIMLLIIIVNLLFFN